MAKLTKVGKLKGGVHLVGKMHACQFSVMPHGLVHTDFSAPTMLAPIRQTLNEYNRND